MRIILLTSDTIQNRALSHMLHEEHELTGIIYENRYNKSNRIASYFKKVNYNPFMVIKKIYQKWSLRKTDSAIINYVNEQYRQYIEFPDSRILEVNNINDSNTISFIKSIEHDIMMVSGTHMIKKKILLLKPKYGIINMHTGLSPYYNGGPSCTFWCLYNEQIYYIGGTVMFIDDGIDSGNIILSEKVELNESDTHASLEFKAIDIGNNLLLKSIKKIEENPNWKGLPQKDIGKGVTYYNRDFTYKKRKDLEKRLKNDLIKKLLSELESKPINVITVE